MSTLPTNLLNQLGHGSTKAAFCPICTHGSRCNVIVHDKERYAPLYIEIRCLNCNQKYWVCRLCRNRRTPFLNYTQLKRHTTISHKNIQGTIFRNEIEDKSIDMNFINEMMVEDDHNNSMEGSIVNEGNFLEIDILQNSYTNKTTMKYIQHELVKKDNGMKYLVSISNFDITLNTVIESLERDEAILQINIARFVMLISRQEQRLFAEILKGILSTNRCIINVPFSKGIIPTNFNSIRKMYIEGENSILSNLPLPVITQMKHHGYVSPIEVIKLMFALNIPFEHIYLKEYNAENHSQDSFYRTKAVEESIKETKKLYQDDEDIMVLFGIKFNDDFDPLNNKTNKGSVFFKSLTISPINNQVESF